MRFLRRLMMTVVMVNTLVGSMRAEETTSERSQDERLRRQTFSILQRLCFDCHGDGADEGNLCFDDYPTVESIRSDPNTWWSILKNVRSDVMPPASEDQPSDEEKRLLFDWISNRVLTPATSTPDPGRTLARRLNRLEYRNTIRDLTGVDFDALVEFPPDDSGGGFDNNADALTVSPLLTEKYLEAAQQIISESVPTQTRVMPVRNIDANSFQSEQSLKGGVFTFSKDSTAAADFEVAYDGTYRVVVPIEVRGSFDFDPHRAQVRIELDGDPLHNKEYGWQPKLEKRLEIEHSLKAGKHQLSIAVETLPIESGKDGQNDDTYVKFSLPSFQVEGPLESEHWIKPENYDRFFHRDRPPAQATERLDYATEVLGRFCRRAYRRPVDPSHLQSLLQLVGLPPRQAIEGASTDTFESRIARAMTVALASPRFLFRTSVPLENAEGRFPPVDEHTLASRLSYFLWSSMPDQQLMDLADRGELRNELGEQVQRMLADRRSEMFIQNFVGQWLQARDLETVSIDPLAALGVRDEYEQLRDYLETMPGGRRTPPSGASEEHRQAYQRYREIRSMRGRLDRDLRRDMGRETVKTFEYVLSHNRPLEELVDADYAFLNERLAKHYGVDGVDGERIRKTELPADSVFGGVLTQGTFLIVTSNPTRTSPVKRGLFILDNLLGTPAPPAPASVPELEESAEKASSENASLRQLLELHRSEALCQSCHQRFDPLGLALENFSAIATWRDKDGDEQIDPAGQLISGESFDSLRELKQVLAVDRREDFYRCVAERMLSYAIGRGLDHRDQATLRGIVDRIKTSDGQALSLIEAVIESAAFDCMRRPIGSLK